MLKKQRLLWFYALGLVFFVTLTLDAHSHRALEPALVRGPQSNESRLVYVDSQSTTSTLLTFDLLTGASQLVTTVSHANGYPIRASLDPTGKHVAYNLLSAGTRPAFNGELWVVSLAPNSTASLIDSETDGGWPPLWDSSGQHIIYLKKKLYQPGNFDRYSEELYTSDMGGHTRRIFADATSLEIVPIGWSADDTTVYVDRILPGGDAIYQIEVNTGSLKLIAPLSTTAATGVALSPEKYTISANIPISSPSATKTYSLEIISLKDGRIVQVAAGSLRPYLSTWGSSGLSLFITNSNSVMKYDLSSVLQGSASVTTPLLHETISVAIGRSGVHAISPISASADGRWLLLSENTTSGESFYLQNQTTDMVRSVPVKGWGQFIGWLNSGQ